MHRLLVKVLCYSSTFCLTCSLNERCGLNRITVYRVTRKLTIKAGFVFDLPNAGLPLSSTSRQLVSDYNFDTVFTNCTVLFKLNSLYSVQHGFPSPSENSNYYLKYFVSALD